MEYSDRILYCRDCQQAFTFTAGEQEFFASRGLSNAPSRCPTCRAARKQAGGGYSNRGQGTGYRQREARPMYPITCARCGKQAAVPFQPRDDRPVYCSECYQQQASGRAHEQGERWSWS